MSSTGCDVQVSLVFANQSEDDIILKDELDKMEREHDNLKVSGHLLYLPAPCRQCCFGI